MKNILLGALLGLMFTQTQAQANTPSPANPHTHCFDFAAIKFDVDVEILRAIAKVESGYNVHALNVNNNHSFDLGLMQINSIHTPVLNKAGIKMEDLLDPCTNVIVGAWLLKGAIDRAGGDTWKGVGYYHSATPRFYQVYIAKVKKALAVNQQHQTAKN